MANTTRKPRQPRQGNASAASSERTPNPAIDWRRVAWNVLASRQIDEIEESTNRDRARIPKEHVVMYQFSARGHDVAQIILGDLIKGRRDAAGAYYRSRPFLLSLGLPLDDAFGSPLGRAGGFSDGRDIGVVCNLPNRDGPVVLPMSGDVGSQYTPAVGWAQSAQYHYNVLRDHTWDGAIAVALGGDASVATSGFWSALTIATTLTLPMLFCIEDNNLGISVTGDMQTPGANIARNLGAFGNLFIRDGDGTDPHVSAALLSECVNHVRSGSGPALVRLTVPRLSSHSGPDNQKGYRSEAELAADAARDPLPRLREYLVPAMMSDSEWDELEADVTRSVQTALEAARARPLPDPAGISRYVFAEETSDGDVAMRGSAELAAEVRFEAAMGERSESAVGARPHTAMGGLTQTERAALGGTDVPTDDGELLRFAEAVRRTLRHELAVNPKLLVFGEDVGRKGGVHLVTEGLQKQFGAERVFDTSLSEEGIIGRASGMAIAGLMPVAEIQFRKYADPATEQLNNTGTMRWRTANRFAAPMVVRMPGGFGKDVGDPWHSLSDEVRFAHAYGWQVVMPSNASDAVGLLRAAMRSANPTIFFEHRSLLMTGDGSARYPGDDYVLPFGKARVVQSGARLTVVTWGAMVHRCVTAAAAFGDAVELIDLRTISPWDTECVLGSVQRTGRCLIVHEDNLTAGFGAEISATITQHAFWHLDAPVVRLAPRDIPMPYHPVLLDAVLPNADGIGAAIADLLAV